MSRTEPASRPIPALWITIGVPLATVMASIVTIWLAVSGAEPELPDFYHSEGLEFDADLARARRAAELGVRAELVLTPDGAAAVTLTVDSPRARVPDALSLRLTHATLAAGDRSWVLERGRDGTYRGAAEAPGDGPWLVQLDASEEWRLRGRLADTGQRLRLGASSP